MIADMTILFLKEILLTRSGSVIRSVPIVFSSKTIFERLFQFDRGFYLQHQHYIGQGCFLFIPSFHS